MSRFDLRKTLAISALGLTLLGGCNTDPHDPEGYFYAKRGWIDPQATLIAEGKGALSFTAPQYGKLYVIDTEMKEPTERILVPSYSFLVQKGLTLRTDPAADQVTVGEDVTNVRLDEEHTFRLYWLPIVQN